MIGFLIVLVIGALYLGFMQKGHNWGGDFGMYIHHTKNMVEGRNYRDTGYIYNPKNPIGPECYPPIFPLLLVPIYQHSGLNLEAMKVECVLFFLLALFSVFFVFKNELKEELLLILLLVVGLNPYFFNFKENVLSDFPFLFFIYFSFYFVLKRYEGLSKKNPKLGLSIGVGILCYLAYGTRSIGLILLMSLLAFESIKYRRIHRYTIALLVVFITLVFLQQRYVGRINIGYGDMFKLDPRLVFRNLKGYGRDLCFFWYNGFSSYGTLIVSLWVNALAFYGVWHRFKNRGITILEIFFISYFMVLCLWPYFQGARFLFPLFPLLVFYAFLGLQRFRSRWVSIILIAVISFSYLGFYRRMESDVTDGIETVEAKELFSFIREKTGKDDVFIFEKPQVISLFTDRRSAVYAIPHQDEELLNDLEEIHAGYLITSKMFLDDTKYLEPFLKRKQSHFKEVFSNSQFKVFKRINGKLIPGSTT